MVFVGSRHFTTCLWFMQIFTICHVYAVKGRYEYFFTPNRDVELQEGKVSIENGKARFAQCVCFLLFFGLTLKFQNHARVSPFLLKIQAWCRKSWKYWFEHKQEHAYIYIFIHIYLFIYFKCIAGNGFCWFEAFYNMFMIYANFHDLPRICSKKPLRVLFHPQQRCGITREKSKHRTWQSPVCTVCLFFVVFWVDPEVSKSRMVQEIVKVLIWARAGTCKYIYIYLFIFILNAQQGMVFVGSRHFTTCLWFMPIFTICHVYAVKRPLRVLFSPPTEMWIYKREK